MRLLTERRQPVADGASAATARVTAPLLRLGGPIVVLVALAGGVFDAMHGIGTGVGTGIGTGLALLVAGGMVLLALSLPGLVAEGAVVALLSLAAAVMAWSHTTEPRYTFAVLGLQVVVFAAWTFPWFRHLAPLARLGSAWLGVAVWLLGAVSALVLAPSVGVQRLVYAGIAVLTVLMFIRGRQRTGRDVSIGLVAGILIGLAFIVAVGSGNFFSLSHYAPPGPWGYRFNGRFWGGPLAVLHPNGMALAALIVSLRIGPDRRFATWQRLAALTVTTLMLYETNSRTGVLAAFLAGLSWTILTLWRSRHEMRSAGRFLSSRRGALTVGSALLPLILVIAVFIAAGGRGFLLSQRYGTAATQTSSDAATAADDLNTQSVTSGRTQNWSAIFRDWRHDTLLEKAFGNTDNTRGYLLRQAASVKNQPKLTADNAGVSELRRGGVLGVLAFIFGFGLLFWRAFRRDTPVWWRLSVIGAFATVATSDQSLGGTGTTLLLLLTAGEVSLFAGSFTGWRRRSAAQA